MFQERQYRNSIQGIDDLIDFKVIVKETDVWIRASKQLEKEAREAILQYRGHIEHYIAENPDFAKTLRPWPDDLIAPPVVKSMIRAGATAGVGPMAAVAGAMAESIGNALRRFSDQIVVENGGDNFIHLNGPITVGLYAGDSPLSMKIGIELRERQKPVAVCTSSGTIGHSLSFGNADAVTVVSDSCALADAAATAIANRVKSHDHIGAAINFGKNLYGVQGIVIIVKGNLGLWGELKIVKLDKPGVHNCHP